jgi:hypothetical protein
MAVLGSPGNTYERLLWRKLPVGIRFSDAGNDPQETLSFESSRAAKSLNQLVTIFILMVNTYQKIGRFPVLCST